jgi:hypothetical protein
MDVTDRRAMADAADEVARVFGKVRVLHPFLDTRTFYHLFCSISLTMSQTRIGVFIASHDFMEKIYANPLVAEGRLFIRTEKALYCFQTRK